MSKSVMIQGTMSNAGKSFFAAALCRIFRQDGFSCAPFKSQNMALNSFITKEGHEIGRAQAMQAQAAGVEPSVLMNPVLLKPTTDVGSQIIVNGKAVSNMAAAEYFRFKKTLKPEIKKAYDTLASQHDIIVIEGAGSPVELNLKSDDIVNMGMAKLAGSPVLLVGDIDRGGVFAQLLGTLDLLEPDERNMVKGLVVNRFRGDIGLFREGVDILEKRGKTNVLGVVPYIHCDIEDEDSLSEKLDGKGGGLVEIAVIRLPKLSNFTDFDVFAQYDGVSVRYVSKYQDLGEPDMIIIPGTKSTISDMKWLRESGMETVIKKRVYAGTPLFGICGGYQILGNKITDETGAEILGSIEGMGLLECETFFETEKKQTQTKGVFKKTDGFFSCLTGAEFEGYEIHMGRTEITGPELLSCGGTFSGNVYGCYIHGVFDNADVSSRIVRRLFENKGIDFTSAALSREAYRETQFDLLADAVRSSIDMEMLYRIIEDGV